MGDTGERIKVILAGVTGWTGKAVAAAILASDDLQLVGAVSRRAAGQELGAALALNLKNPAPEAALKISASVEIAARHLPHWEIIDYASDQKIDVPSGTARELAEELAQVKSNKLGYPLSQIVGPTEARGAQIAGTPVHSVRLPGFVLSFETIFGLPDQRLSIRHDAGGGVQPYVDGTLLAVRRVGALQGLTRGLDTLLLT